MRSEQNRLDCTIHVLQPGFDEVIAAAALIRASASDLRGQALFATPQAARP